MNRLTIMNTMERGTLIPQVTGAVITKEDRSEIIAKTLVNPFSLYKLVSLDEKPVSFDTYVSGSDNNIRATRGIYTITYVSRPNSQGKNYMVSQDLMSGMFTVSGWPHFVKLCERIPELAWIKRNSIGLCPELFAMAKRHPGLGFQFTIDWIRYGQKIIETAEAEGIDIDNKPFVAFKCNYKDFDEKYRFKVLGPKKRTVSYRDMFRAAEAELAKLSNTVQKEEE